MVIDEDIYLEHYGVKGMKWGVRKERRAANKQAARVAKATKYLNKASVLQTKISELENSPKRMTPRRSNKIVDLKSERHQAILDAKAKSEGKLTDKQRKLLIGAAAVGVIVAAGVTYGALQRGDVRQVLEKGKDFFKDKYDPGWKLDRSLADPMDPNQIMTKIVPKINPNYGAPGTKVNCRRATFAYEMRRRGYDVVATKTNTGAGQTVVGMDNILNISDPDLPTSKPGMIRGIINQDSRLSDLLKDGSKMGEKQLNPTSIFYDMARDKDLPDGARGELGMLWASGGGHSMAWEKIKGKVVIFDTQSGIKYETPEDFKEMAENMADVAYTRLDNKTIDSNFLMKWVKNA